MTEIFILFLIFGFLGGLLVVMNKFLGPKRSNPTKDTPFECGSPFLQKSIGPVPIKFYLVAFLFLLFDIEVVFFFPWALVFKEMALTGLVVMFAYMLVLVVGFVYAWKKGAFKWEN
jgi:NADH-quinone oxidoreductase subunit A